MDALHIITLVLVILILRKVYIMANEMERMTTEVSEATTVMESAKTLLSTLADEIRANANNAIAMGQLADSLDAKSNELAEAVAANTQAEDEEPAPTE
jgi:Na+-transporting NADH:ubiquinone oxidoreductase subunit NqrF